VYCIFNLTSRILIDRKSSIKCALKNAHIHIGVSSKIKSEPPSIYSHVVIHRNESNYTTPNENKTEHSEECSVVLHLSCKDFRPNDLLCQSNDTATWCADTILGSNSSVAQLRRVAVYTVTLFAQNLHVTSRVSDTERSSNLLRSKCFASL